MINKKLVCDCGCEDGSGGQGFKESTYQYLLSEKRTILLSGNIDDSVVERVVIPIMGINELDDESEENNTKFVRENNPIKIIINSNGGDVFSTLSCCSAISSSKTPVHTYALSKAFSGGFFILLAGHVRYCQAFSTMMYHQIQAQPTRGALQTNKEDVEESLRLQHILNEFVLDRTKIKPKVLAGINEKKIDWFLSASDALKMGIVDDISF